jgi:4-hydroxybenzoate polyprenyltransferase
MTVMDRSAARSLPAANGLPLCVDLDGTLTYADTLLESMVSQCFRPQMARALIALPVIGSAAFKERIAALGDFDPALLPYNQALLLYLKRQKLEGRYLVLATAANRAVANAVADHVGLFDEVIASDAKRNLKGRAKAAALCERFGDKGFVYAGNDTSDIAVWKVAAAALPVNAAPAVIRRSRHVAEVEESFPPHPSPFTALLRAMRPHQWVKNLLVFIPIFTAHAIGDVEAWISAVLTFAAFCAMASAIYLINDVTDLAADRRHPRKRLRPFASGALPLPTGLAAAAILAATGTAFAIASDTLGVIAIYALMSTAYSLTLKEKPLVDVFLLGALYTIRLFGGGVATGHALSLWLLAFSAFLFLGLALLKRVAELGLTRQVNAVPSGRRGYMTADIPVLQAFGCAASFASSLVLALFVQREVTATQYASPGLLWGIVPIMLFWQCRLWLSTARGYMHDDPIVYSAHDWVSWIVGGSVMLVLLLAYSITI